MPPREDENPDLNPLCGGDPLARQLAVLQPLPAGLNRDQLLYAAGAAARDRDVAFWKRLVVGQSAVLCTLVGVGVGLMEWKGGDPRADVVQTPAHVLWVEQAPPPRPADDEPSFPSGPGPQFAGADADDLEPGELAKLLRLRADVFAAGLGVLPTPTLPPPRADATALEQSLQLPKGVLAAPPAPAKPKPPE